MLTPIDSPCHNVTMFDVYVIWTDADGVMWIGPEPGPGIGVRVYADGRMVDDYITRIGARLDPYTAQ